MAIAFVNDTAHLTTGVNPTLQSVPTGTTAGNFLVGQFHSDSTLTGFTIGSGWTIGGQVDTAFGSMIVVYKANCAANESAASVSYTGAAVTCFTHSAQFSGMDTAAVLDQFAATSGTTSPITATASAADTASGALIYVTSYSLLSKAGTATTSHTLNNGATATTTDSDDAQSQTVHRRTAYGVTTGNSAADSDQFDNSSMNITNMRVMIASFSNPVAATFALPPIAPRHNRDRFRLSNR